MVAVFNHNTKDIFNKMSLQVKEKWASKTEIYIVDPL